jgi:hypothetical protein
MLRDVMGLEFMPLGIHVVPMNIFNFIDNTVSLLFSMVSREGIEPSTY